MAIYTRYVDPNSTAGGDGTTNALIGASRAYVSVNAWEAAQQSAHGATDTDIVYCSSDDAGSTHAADTTAVEILGWTDKTDGNYIGVQAASSHGGKWDDTIYRMEMTNPSAHIFIIGEANVRVIGIQVKLTLASAAVGSARVGVYNTNGDAVGSGYIDKCIVRGVISGTNTTVGYGFMTEYGTHTKYIRNCIAYDFINGTEGHIGFRTRSNVEWDNCTAHNCREGFVRSINTATAKNCGAAACTTGFAGTITQTTCSTTTPTFIDEAGDDFHLASGDTTWKDQGTDLSGTFSDDIDGVARTGTWDIGADEYVAAGGGSVEITPTIGSLSASSAASRNDRGIFVPTEID